MGQHTKIPRHTLFLKGGDVVFFVYSSKPKVMSILVRAGACRTVFCHPEFISGSHAPIDFFKKSCLISAPVFI